MIVSAFYVLVCVLDLVGGFPLAPGTSFQFDKRYGCSLCQIWPLASSTKSSSSLPTMWHATSAIGRPNGTGSCDCHELLS